MTNEKWKKVATEMQVHINALAEIAEREKLDIVSIALYGEGDGKKLRSAMSYIDREETVYTMNTYKDGFCRMNRYNREFGEIAIGVIDGQEGATCT